MSDVDNDVRREKIATIAKYVIGIGALAVLAPIIFTALQGLIALIAFGVIGLAAINFAPVLAYKLANWKMKAIVADAKANPIETMQNLFVDKTKELETADNNITEFDTEVRNYDDQLGGFKQDYPEEASTYQSISDKMHQALADMYENQKEARHALQDFAAKIKKAKAIYQMALAAQKVLTLSKSAESQVFAQIREQVAFDTVRSQLNSSFAKLNMAVEKRAEARALTVATQPAAPAALTQQRGNIIDVAPIKVTQTVGGR